MSSKSKNLRAFVSSCETKTEVATPALVPQLRFPGFSGPWAHEPLSKVLKEHKLKNTAGRDVFSVSMEYGIVNQIELLGRSYAAADPSHYTIGRRFDVVYTKSPLKAFPFGVVKQCKFDGEVALSPLYGVFTPPNPHLGLMIEAYFESPNRSKDFLSPLCQKGAKNTLQITNTTFLSGRLPLPTQPAEQQKIAECLSSVDELIAAQARKLDALKTHKKGLMQQLFPREGETQPRLRFPEFQNAGEWEANPLGQLIEIASGQVDPKQLPYCDCPQVGSENIESHSGKLVNVKSAGEKGLISGNYAFDENDILYSKIRPALNKVATPTFKGICSAEIYPVRPADGRLIRNYLFYLLLSQDFLNYAILNSERGKIPKINRDALMNYTALIPSPAEQQRIASCLTSLDDLITAQTQKHEALKTHKKGLMQQLFPSPEEPS
jgi:type I restriction enzyme S subunit